MKKTTIIILTLSLILSLFWLIKPSELRHDLFVTKAGCGCDQKGEGLAYNFGAYLGECVDNCKFRDLKLKTVNDHKLALSDVMDLEGHTTFEFHPQHLESVYVLFDRFAPKLNHVALIFMFRPENQQIKGLVLSPEAIQPHGRPYSLLDGLLSRYAINYQAYTIEKYIQNSVDLKYPLKKYRLNLTRDHQKNLLLYTLNQAETTSFKTPYHLLSRNCATTVLDLILDSKDEEPTMARVVWNLFDPLRGIPFEWVGTKRSLSWWQLIDPHAEWLHEPEVGQLTPIQ